MIARFQKLGTSAVSDALDSLGVAGGLVGIRQQVAGTSCVGPAFTVEYMPLEAKEPGFRNASNYIDEVPAGHVVVIDNQGKDSCTTWGDILTGFALENGIAGTVIHGAARDISAIRSLGYPLFSSHIFMQSGKNRVVKRLVNKKISISGVEIYPGDLMVCDANGCLCVPQAHIQTVLERAEQTEKTEELIREAIREGMPVREARKKFAYHQPWNKKEQR